MRICIFTKFWPSIGGIETVAELLALEWSAAGHGVTIVTDVARVDDKHKEFPFLVLHRPHPFNLLKAVLNSDVVIHHNISLKVLWPLLFTSKPFVAVNHDRYGLQENGHRHWKEWHAKVWVARRWANNISVSQATKQAVGCDGPVIHNLYDQAAFQNYGRTRGKDLVFVGRLVSDKGVNVLLDALDELKGAGLKPTLTVIGDGPERDNIERQIRVLGLEKQVILTGRLSRDEVVNVLNNHKIMVIPSVFDEGFGVVALEGAACGCVLVGSESGGLREAVGPCGKIFPKGDKAKLAGILIVLLRGDDELEPFRHAATEHLSKHSPTEVAREYTEFFTTVVS